VNGSLKLGIARMGVVVIACLSIVNAAAASASHLKFPFLSKLVRGRASTP
jgi:hypothetical protein